MNDAPRTPRLRRAAPVLLALAALVATAGPAAADVPEGWSTDPQPVSAIHAVLVVAGIPLLLFLVISAFFFVPALLRGERVAPGPAPVTEQWLGGPRRGTAELAGPDDEKSSAGGARGSW